MLQRRPNPLSATVYGTGLGALSASIITKVMAWVKKTSDVFLPLTPETPREDKA